MIWRGRNEPQGAPAPDPRLQQQAQQPQPPQAQPPQPPPEPQPPAKQQQPQPPQAPQQQQDPQQEGQVGSRIESVIGAAEQAASGIREDAQEWARSYLEESRRRADEIASQRI